MCVVNFVSWVGASTEIVEPLKHLLRATAYPQSLMSGLQVPMDTTLGQYGMCKPLSGMFLLLLIFWCEGAYPVFKLVGPLLLIQSKAIPFKNQVKQFESWSNSLKVVQPPGQLESWLNKQPMTQTA